jgi:exopolysaccharide biosynthesis WecB/TagA/CpsF family protein
MDYEPNMDALKWYFATMHDSLKSRIPNLQVLIVGKSPVAEVQGYERLPGVSVTGSVPDVRPYYQQSWVQMVPLRIGGGTRLKIVESLAMGTPVVSTSIGAQGLNLQHGHDALLADEPTAFVQALVDALTNRDLRESLSQHGRHTAQTRFSWHGIGSKLNAAYQTLIQQKERIELLQIPFDRVTMKGTLGRIDEMVSSGSPHFIATANVDFLVQARSDAELRTVLHRADLVVCDGKPLVWLSRLLGKALPERVAGSDLVPRLLATAEQNGWSVYFLGGREDVLEQAVHNTSLKHPGLRIAGAYSPPFAPLDQMDHQDICERITAAKPDLLLVSFGCPKQEKWIARHYAKLQVPVSIGVGATIDFLAGTMKRAPRWMQQSGLEWVFRLLQEPRRLVKRYATDLVVFGLAALNEIVRNQIPARA